MDLLFQPRIKLYGNDGVTPLASGRVTFYLANTVTPSTAYVNSTGTPATNPVILDSRGEAVLYLNPALTYDLFVQSADLAYSYTIEDVKVGINSLNGSIIVDGSIPASKIADNSLPLGKLESALPRTLMGNSNNSLTGYVSFFTPTADFDFVGNNLRMATTERVSAMSIASGAVAIDLSVDNYRTLLLNANVTAITFSGLPAAGRAMTWCLEVKQDATGGRTVAGWPASVTFLPSAYTPTSTANKKDLISFTSFDQGASWVATYVKGY